MSIRWANDPPNPSRLPYIDLRRLGAAEHVTGAITCHKPLSVWCHYLSGRTLPCVDEDCPGCVIERRRFRECYLTVWTVKPAKHRMIVLTPTAEDSLLQKSPQPGHFRGYVIEASRVGNKPNGRICIEYTGQFVAANTLPPAPDLETHLYQLWGLTPEQLGSEHPLYNVRHQFDLSRINGNGAHTAPE